MFLYASVVVSCMWYCLCSWGVVGVSEAAQGGETTLLWLCRINAFSLGVTFEQSLPSTRNLEVDSRKPFWILSHNLFFSVLVSACTVPARLLSVPHTAPDHPGLPAPPTWRPSTWTYWCMTLANPSLDWDTWTNNLFASCPFGCGAAVIVGWYNNTLSNCILFITIIIITTVTTTITSNTIPLSLFLDPLFGTSSGPILLCYSEISPRGDSLFPQGLGNGGYRMGAPVGLFRSWERLFVSGRGETITSHDQRARHALSAPSLLPPHQEL